MGYFGPAAKKYLADEKIDGLVDADRVERIEPTNHHYVVQVTVAGDDHDPNENFAAYRDFLVMEFPDGG